MADFGNPSYWVGENVTVIVYLFIPLADECHAYSLEVTMQLCDVGREVLGR